MHFRLNAGECIVFDNHRIVHGRAGYTAESGERYLRGCYVDREEMKSRYRTLTSAGGRFRAA
jgi:gamma-butyrobetaine dioxygenase